VLNDKHHNQWTTLQQVSLHLQVLTALAVVHLRPPFFWDGAGALGTGRHAQLLIGHVDFEDEITKLSRNVGDQSHGDAAPHPTRTGDLVLPPHLMIFLHFSPFFSPFFPLSFPYYPFPFVSYLPFPPSLFVISFSILSAFL